jgi:ketosteroid isomerase-like protein
MIFKHAGILILILSLISCDNNSPLIEDSITASESFLDAFYSFNPDELQAVLASAEESLPKMLFYQGWAKGGHYEVVERFPCERSSDETIDCSITVKDDLMGALGIDFNVTDTFHLTVTGARITAVTNSSNDPQAYWDAEEWVRTNRPGLIELPCEGFFDGGPTPGDCVRAMVRGYSEFAASGGLYEGDQESAEQSALEFQSARLKAMIDADIDTLERYLADDLTYSHTTGWTETKSEFLSTVESQAIDYVSVTPRDIEVRIYGDIAVITGLSRMQGAVGNRSVSFTIRFLDVSRRVGDSWQLVAWQSVKFAEDED